MFILDTPDRAFIEQRATLDEIEYFLIYRFNSRDKKYRLDIYDANQELLIGGVVVAPQMLVTSDKYLPEILGEITLIKNKETTTEPTITNIGIDEEWQLVYYENNELI